MRWARPLRSLDLSTVKTQIGRRGWRAMRVALSTGAAGATVQDLNLSGQTAIDLCGLTLPTLEKLDVSGCKLQDDLVADCPRLKQLEARSNPKLTGVSHGLLPPTLEVLYLDLAVDLRACPHLRELWSPAVLGDLPPLLRLEVLFLPQGTLDARPFNEGHFPALKQLHLFKLRGELAPLASLEKLSGALPSQMQLFGALKEVSVRNCQLREFPPPPPHLQRLVLSSCRRLRELPSLPPHLQHLELSDCHHLRQLPPLPQCLARLKLIYCAGLRELPPLPQVLKELQMSSNGRVAAAALPPGLEELRLRFCLLAHHLDLTSVPRLRVLDLSENPGLGEDLDLPRLDYLEELSLLGCDIEYLPDIRFNFPRLRALNVDENPSLELDIWDDPETMLPLMGTVERLLEKDYFDDMYG